MEDGRRSREVVLLLFLGDLAHTSSHQINKMEKSTSLDDIRQCENKHANGDEMPVLTQSPDDDDDVPDLVPENQLHWDEQLTLRERLPVILPRVQIKSVTVYFALSQRFVTVPLLACDSSFRMSGIARADACQFVSARELMECAACPEQPAHEGHLSLRVAPHRGEFLRWECTDGESVERAWAESRNSTRPNYPNVRTKL
ncbi:hypothetical protein B0H13DRAFT_2346922 [Mycena leptocephala]|nr:hypothetical protein B0H13DRAFT_2346922 [Mycena leptocephala]